MNHGFINAERCSAVKYKTPFTRNSRLSKRLYNRFDNRLYRVNKHPTGLTAVLNERTVRSTRLSNRLYNPVWQPAVYTIQPFVKPVVKRVWQPVECLHTQPVLQRVWQPVASCIQTFNRLSNRFDNRFDNRLYRVNELQFRHFSNPTCINEYWLGSDCKWPSRNRFKIRKTPWTLISLFFCFRNFRIPCLTYFLKSGLVCVEIGVGLHYLEKVGRSYRLWSSLTPLGAASR